MIPRLWQVAMLLLFLFAGPAHSSPPPPRPDSGCGVLALHPEPGANKVTLSLYAEPGLERMAELDSSTLPRLSGSATDPLVAVSARKGEWTRLTYDDAGRQGWIRQARAWRYLSWQEYLPGRCLLILPGMKKGYYALRSEPGAGGGERENLTRKEAVYVLQVDNDWVRLQAPSGWFRWRDDDGRLTVALPGEP